MTINENGNETHCEKQRVECCFPIIIITVLTAIFVCISSVPFRVSLSFFLLFNDFLSTAIGLTVNDSVNKYSNKRGNHLSLSFSLSLSANVFSFASNTHNNEFSKVQLTENNV